MCDLLYEPCPHDYISDSWQTFVHILHIFGALMLLKTGAKGKRKEF